VNPVVWALQVETSFYSFLYSNTTILWLRVDFKQMPVPLGDLSMITGWFQTSPACWTRLLLPSTFEGLVGLILHEEGSIFFVCTWEENMLLPALCSNALLTQVILYVVLLNVLYKRNTRDWV
jgi:hypothetical protein